MLGSFEGVSVKARSGPLDHVKGGHIEAFRPYSGQLEPSKVARSTHTENYRSSAGMEAARLQPGHAHKSTGLPDYSRHFPGQAGQPGRPHSGQLDPARVAHSSEHVRQPTAVDLFLQYGESTNWQPDAGRVERDEEVRSDGDSTRPLLSADESWALLEAVPQTGHAPVDLPLQVCHQFMCQLFYSFYWSLRLQPQALVTVLNANRVILQLIMTFCQELVVFACNTFHVW